ncbi:MAG: MBL fold metallo-hydrolase, partial [Lentisphaeria bacterium]|nr:MBL fold metallo-hydrolase [Lentisphaeria bacterium]
MKIKAVKFNEKGFMTQPFAMGGEDGVEKFDAKVRYRSCLQNYLIDTGDEVILVDTGLPVEYPEMVVEENTQIYIGSRIVDYMTAFRALGYRPEQVTKILVTHK